jgi:transketolase
VSGAAVPARALEAYRDGLTAAVELDPSLAVLDAGVPSAPAAVVARFADRYRSYPHEANEAVVAALERSADGSPTFLAAALSSRLEDLAPSIVRDVFLARRNVKLVGVPAEGGPPAFEDDVGRFRSVPSATVVAPADAPTARTATVVVAGHEGPTYLRLPTETAVVVSDGAFALGRATELRAGDDLAVVALGPMVARARELAEELARIGVSVRLLDAASVKPFDEASILRAARDTGAILVAESAPLATGIGTLVAALTAENYPVPVRRLGWPDLRPARSDAAGLDELGLSLERLRDEAWELLRLRGKVS